MYSRKQFVFVWSVLELGKKQKKRHLIQSIWALCSNGYLAGFAQGKIYTGKWKNLCVPGMNCYSCPGALGSCPIGALQAVLGDWKFKFAYYIVGFLIFVGALIGRVVCGWLCPFGLVQDLLHKIPFPKKIKNIPKDRVLRKLKYVILIVFVILLPLFCVDLLGQGAPYFCKWICPVGTLEGGVMLVLLDQGLRSAVGWLYTWKIAILAVILLLSVLIYRPFCKYLCPLGAIYSVFNPISVFRYRVEKERCTNCSACARVCKMGCDPVKNPNDLECIRCGACRDVCPAGAITCGIRPAVSEKSRKNRRKNTEY